MLRTVFVSGEKLPWKYYDDYHADLLLWFDAFSNFFLKSLFVLHVSNLLRKFQTPYQNSFQMMQNILADKSPCLIDVGNYRISQ